jgi:SET domain-containing protein
LREITAGEELTYNYGYDARNYQENPCNCGAQSCCGYILAQEHWGLIP